MVLSTVRLLCKHHYHPFPELFHFPHLKCCPLQHESPTPFPQPPGTTLLLSVSLKSTILSILCIYWFLHIVYTYTKCMYILFIYLSTEGHLSCFYLLATINKAATNIGIQISLWILAFSLFGYLSRSGIARLWGNNPMFCFEETSFIFRSWYTILHSHQQCTGVLISLHPHQYLKKIFFVIAIPMGKGLVWFQGFPGSLVGNESSCNGGDLDSIPGLGRSPAERLGYPLQYSWASLLAHTVKNPPAMRRPGFHPWAGKIPWRRAWQPTPVFLPGESQGLRSLVGYSWRGHKESEHNWATKHSDFNLHFPNNVELMMAS